jgi:hypothetical protein
MTDEGVARSADESSKAQDEAVDEAGEESFPASDPPSTWSGEDPRDVAAKSSDASQASG